MNKYIDSKISLLVSLYPKQSEITCVCVSSPVTIFPTVLNGACNNFIVFKERTYEGRKQFTSMKVAKTYELLMNSNEDSIILQ